MNLTFTEMDNLDYQGSYKTYYDDLLPETPNNNNIVIQENNQNQNQNQIQTKKSILKSNTNNMVTKPKKKQISYDDILSSMNTVVIDGKLEFIRKDRLNSIIENQQMQQQQFQQPYKKRVAFNQPPPNNPQPQINKSSYIYNKYFKDYKDPNYAQYEEPSRPLTKKELIRQLIINKVNAINERNRIAEIKSTKLLFNNNNNRNIIINSSPAHNQSAMNHLFRFK